MNWPRTARGVLITLAGLAILAVALVTTGLAPLALGVVVILLVAYVIWVIGVRIHRWATEGRVLPRRGGGD